MNLASYANVLIIRLAISGLPGVSKTDQQETKILVNSKGTNKRHARVTKTLFSDSLRAIDLRKLTTEVRNWLRAVSLPGEVDGKYMIPAARFRELAAKLNTFQTKYHQIVDDFIQNLAGEILVDQLGKQGMFTESDYPTATEIARHAKFDWGFEPLPESSGFVGMFDTEALDRDYADKHENHIASMFEKATAANLNRLQTRLIKAINTLTNYSGAAGQRLRANDLIVGLETDGREAEALNVANDERVAEISQALIDFSSSFPIPDNLKDHTIRARALAELQTILGDGISEPIVNAEFEQAPALPEVETVAGTPAVPENIFEMSF